jgi:polysaccharide deacetylase family protein (PEP-CTERM system associated)
MVAISMPLASECLNALTIDVEDYFQVQALEHRFPREDWGKRELRVAANVDRILEMLDTAGSRATFFTLAWIARREPALVRRIVAAGHELASHGMTHIRADRQSPAEFLADVTEARHVLEDVGGVAVRGYRAASLSIGPSNLWAFDKLVEAGYRYSSSVFPGRHDIYGMPDASRFSYRPVPGEPFVELPLTTVERFGMRLHAAGGGYFRLLPYRFSRANMRKVNRVDGQPCIFYFHPWEIDHAQPRVDALSTRTRVRHYTNLAAMEGKLRRLLADFRWDRVDRTFPELAP